MVLVRLLHMHTSDDRMIREMQVHGVRPIAVWDERGDRPWKAPEVSCQEGAQLTSGSAEVGNASTIPRPPRT